VLVPVSAIPLSLIGTFTMILLIGFLYVGSKSELAPDEDQGFIMGLGTAAANATLQQRQLYNKGISDGLVAMPETETVFEFDLPTQTIFGHVLKPWNRRTATVAEIRPRDQAVFDGSAGLEVVGFSPPPLPGSTGLPLQLVIGAANDFEQLGEVSDLFRQKALETGRFIFLDNDLKLDKKQSTVVIDRDKTAQLGSKLSDVGGALGVPVGGGHVDWFSLAGRSYKVIPQITRQFRLTADQILDSYLRAADGSMVPLRTVATIVDETEPESLDYFQ
jgi:multidrug efflux pump